MPLGGGDDLRFDLRPYHAGFFEARRNHHHGLHAEFSGFLDQRRHRRGGRHDHHKLRHLRQRRERGKRRQMENTLMLGIHWKNATRKGTQILPHSPTDAALTIRGSDESKAVRLEKAFE